MDTTDWPVSGAEAGTRLDKFLAADGRLGSRSKAADALRRGKVFLNGAEAGLVDAARLLTEADTVRVWMDRPGTAAKRAPRRDGVLDIVYEDAALIAVNKPAGLLTVPLATRETAPSVLSLLTAAMSGRGARKPFVVHRIDRDTSGLVLFARTPAAQADIKAQFQRRQPERVYWAVVHGQVLQSRGEWRDLLTWDPTELRQEEADEDDPRAAEAISRFQVVERLRDATLIEVRLVTGKRNQIRMQAALHGHPLVGERQYLEPRPPAHPIAFDRQALHARRLNVAHPVSGEFVHLEAALPPDMEHLLARLR
ncbi:MAG: RluA family pseudouridine synthase [Alphaproteobacteria bacterium]